MSELHPEYQQYQRATEMNFFSKEERREIYLKVADLFKGSDCVNIKKRK